MQIRYPKSFFKLLFIGFMLAVLPLLVGLFGNILAIERLAAQSQRAGASLVWRARMPLLVPQMIRLRRSVATRCQPGCLKSSDASPSVLPRQRPLQFGSECDCRWIHLW